LLGRALRIDPDYAPAHRVYWIALLQTGQNDAALTALRAACSVLPDDPELHRQLERLEVAMR
jgi:Tfp pilus assembly protein PilF